MGVFGQIRTPFITFGEKRAGSFSSLESANDFVNRTLERNSAAVDRVATGQQTEAFVTSRFGYKTGREARADDDIEPYMRDTYGVGVYTIRDEGSQRGYRGLTAYPRND